MINKKIFGFVLIFAFLTGTAYGQTALDTVRALKKLEARIGIGLNYKEYALNLADAKSEASLFLESSAAKQNKALTHLIQKILSHYETVRVIWNLKMTKTEDFGTVFGYLMSLQDGEEGDLGRNLLQQYPQANKSAEKGGALTMGAYGSKGTNEILVDNMINIIWQEAARDQKEVVKMVVR
jgi:hypothetical protein